jgi:creatinine amidohydrolase
MRRSIVAVSITAAASLASVLAGAGETPGAQTRRREAPPQGQRLEHLSWSEAAPLLTPDAVIVIPLGSASTEHGPHLTLRSDLTLAEHLTERAIARAPIVVAPALTYHYYPAFLEYAGSTSLGLATARDMTIDVVRSLARHGARRFYVLNTGLSTEQPLEAAAKTLASEGVLLRYTMLEARLEAARTKVSRQEGGTHADEIETSMLLHVDPASVDMTKAVKDYGTRSTPFALTPRRDGRGTYSPTGIWGDPTLATPEKGKVLVDALVAAILSDIEATRTATLPTGSPAVTTADAPQPARPPGGAPAQPPDRCSEGDERTIRAIGDTYAASWANGDAERLAGLWTSGGDIHHPDGFIERTRIVIQTNRASLFSRREYRGTRHPLILASVRCLTNDVAVADGKWELRGMISASGEAQPATKGLVTIVARRAAAAWQIEAYRYTIDQPSGPTTPTLQKRPGFPGRGGGN